MFTVQHGRTAGVHRAGRATDRESGPPVNSTGGVVHAPILPQPCPRLDTGRLAFGALAMGYGVYKARTITGNTVGVLISGPHRIGTGPIPRTNA